MSKADEMFEKLSYKKIENNEKWIKYKSTKDYAEIWFDITDREVSATNDDSEGIFITMQELQAINEKVKELRLGNQLNKEIKSIKEK